MMNFPMINTVATGQNINRMRIEAGMTVRDMQEVSGPLPTFTIIDGTVNKTFPWWC